MRPAGVLGAGLGIAAAGAMAWAVRGRSSTVFGPSVHHGPKGQKRIALTFDDGPGPGTYDVLRVLAEYRVPATFFQCGVNVLRDPDACVAVRDAGHEIGNHSHTHPLCALKAPEFIGDQFRRAQETIVQTSGVTATWMRAPFGVRWFGFRAMQAQLGLTGAMWTVIGRDWLLDGQAVAERVMGSELDGGIICLHDGRGIEAKPDIRSTVDAVKRIVPALLERNYQLETLTTLCGH